MEIRNYIYPEMLINFICYSTSRTVKSDIAKKLKVYQLSSHKVYFLKDLFLKIIYLNKIDIIY
jgi:hypothetical protein